MSTKTLCMRAVHLCTGGTAAEVLDDVELQRIRTAAGILDPELMQHAPPMNAFDPIFKSPCWKPAAGASASEGASAAGGLRCLPSFLVTGLFHAGALSLAGALMRHPNVATVSAITAACRPNGSVHAFNSLQRLLTLRLAVYVLCTIAWLMCQQACGMRVPRSRLSV